MQRLMLIADRVRGRLIFLDNVKLISIQPVFYKSIPAFGAAQAKLVIVGLVPDNKTLPIEMATCNQF